MTERLYVPRKLSPHHHGPGLRLRLSRIRGVTPRGVLEQPLRLPVILGDFTVTEEADHRDYTTIGAGEFSSPAPGGSDARSLQEIGLDTLTIDWHEYARFLTAPHTTPQEVKTTLRRLLRSRAPFAVLAMVPAAGGLHEELRMNATMRSLQRTLRAREADTRYFTFALKEWRDNSVDRRRQGHGVKAVKVPLPTRATLTADTTLNSLARHFYGSARYWRNIARANGISSWGASTPLAKSKRFKVGDKVKIPELPSATIDSPRESGGVEAS